jgi:hypothetical protein
MTESALRVGIRIQVWSIHIGMLDRMQPLKMPETSATLATTVPNRHESLT